MGGTPAISLNSVEQEADMNEEESPGTLRHANLPLDCLTIGTKGLLGNVLPDTQVQCLGRGLGLQDPEVGYFLQCRNPVHEMVNSVRHLRTLRDLIDVLNSMELTENVVEHLQQHIGE